MTKNKQIGKIGLANCSRLTDASVIAICQSSQARLTTIGLNSVSNITGILHKRGEAREEGGEEGGERARRGWRVRRGEDGEEYMF